MEFKHGLFSADSHAQLDRDAFTSRMSKKKFGDRIPHVIETTDPKLMSKPWDFPVHRWVVNGKVVDNRWPVNCPRITTGLRTSFSKTCCAALTPKRFAMPLATCLAASMNTS